MTAVAPTKPTTASTAAPTAAEPSAHDQSHAAVLLGLHDDADRSTLEFLRSEPDVRLIDRSTELRAQLRALRPAVSQSLLEEDQLWAWYPWRRALVAVPGPQSFRRLRLDRNRNKITSAEQENYTRLTIGVVGLSVGHSIAHTLAMEGLCGRLRLADHDRIELSNLNRIPATVLDLGVNKAIAVARRIAELDPYLPTEVFANGLTEECIEEFFDGIDLVIEECDSLDMKVRVREEARARGIPVLMETSDRGLFDVERFDSEPDRPLFHGLLGPVEADSLRGLSTHDKAPHVMRILEAANLSPRMAASMVEIDRTLSTWPQLGGDVQLGGATVAAAVRRFGRGAELPSGRVRIDLDGVLDGLRPGRPHPAAPDSTTAAVDLTVNPPAEPVEAVVHAVRLAPSGGNTQPWRICVGPEGVDVSLDRARTSAMDVCFRGSYVSIGAAAFNAAVAAARHGLHASIAPFPNGSDSDLVLSITLRAGEDPSLAESYPAMVARVTNRNVGRRRDFSGESVANLQQAIGSGAGLRLITEPAAVAAVADILAESDRIRFLTPLLHEQMMRELKWPGPDGAGWGIDVHSLGLDAADLAKLAVSSRPDVMAHLGSWRGGAALGDNTRDRINASSAVAVVTIPGATPVDYLHGGMALERLWIETGRQDLALHPVSPVFLYARSDADFTGLSAEFSDELRALQRSFNRAVGIGDSEFPVFVMRLSHDAPPPAVRSGRLDRDLVVSTIGEPRGKGERSQ